MLQVVMKNQMYPGEKMYATSQLCQLWGGNSRFELLMTNPNKDQ